VIEKAAEAVVEPRIPLSPVVAPGNDVEFVMNVALLQKIGKTVIGRKQSFLFAAGQIEERRGCNISGLSECKWIILVARSTTPRPEDCAIVAPLPDSLEGKWAEELLVPRGFPPVR
jgi:hypothetical protein